LPTGVRGMKRVDDRRVLSGIVHALKCGGRWADCPGEVYGPKKTLYNRSCAGPNAASGKAFSVGWLVREMRRTGCSSTVAASRFTVAQAAQKGALANSVGRTKLHGRHRPRRNRHLVAEMSPGPNHCSSEGASDTGLPIRFWISHCDASPGSYNYDLVHKVVVGLELTIRPARERWASSVATWSTGRHPRL
jgi:transposase